MGLGVFAHVVAAAILLLLLLLLAVAIAFVATAVAIVTLAVGACGRGCAWPGGVCVSGGARGRGACRSRNMQARAVMDCASVAGVPIVADGGIRVPGDVAKSIVLGADMVMVGGMLSGFLGA